VALPSSSYWAKVTASYDERLRIPWQYTQEEHISRVQFDPEDQRMPTGSGNRVLVVDDERMIADTLTLILNRSGYHAHAAYSGEDAIELAGSLKPDILVSDVVMGGMSGIEVAIYFANYLPKCRIILISGNIMTASLLEVAGKQGYQFQLLPKPVHPQVLISHLSGPKA
jgi:CheY-like chemotaxis protein